MRLFHVSDTHIGYTAYHRVTDDGLNRREADFAKSLAWFVDKALEERPDLVIHSGDLFDSVRPTNRALAECMTQLRRLAQAAIPVVVIAGNHESPKLRETGSPLRLLEFIPGVRAVFKGRTEHVEMDVPGAHRVVVHAVPQAADNEAFEEELLKAVPVDGAANVLVAHGTASTLADIPGGEFNDLTIPSHCLNPRLEYIALGHYHRQTKVTPNAWYAGSTERNGFGEAGDEKGFLDVLVAPGQPPLVRPRTLPTRRMVDLPHVDAANQPRETVLAEIENRLANRDWTGAMVRLKVRNLAEATYRTIDTARLEALADGALHVELAFELVAATGEIAPAPSFNGLADEFRAFLANVPLNGVDRARIQALAERYLGKELVIETRGGDG